MDAIARFALTVGVVPAVIALELWAPRRRAPVQWRVIGMAAALLALNTLVGHVLSIAPASDSMVRIVAAWVLAEVFAYWVHRAMHAVPLLWRFHRVHHAPGTVAWHRSWWIHPADLVLFVCATDVACWIAGAPHVAAGWFLVVRRAWSLLLHANVRWPCSPVDHVIVTPSFHDRHHREDLPPANFAGNFAIVDHLFGTWQSPRPWREEPRASRGVRFSPPVTSHDAAVTACGDVDTPSDDCARADRRERHSRAA